MAGAQNLVAKRVGEQRVVAAFLRVDAQVLHLPALVLKVPAQGLFKREARVIRSDEQGAGNHGFSKKG